jgi:uncharacterized membrane protein
MLLRAVSIGRVVVGSRVNTLTLRFVSAADPILCAALNRTEAT